MATVITPIDFQSYSIFKWRFSPWAVCHRSLNNKLAPSTPRSWHLEWPRLKSKLNITFSLTRCQATTLPAQFLSLDKVEGFIRKRSTRQQNNIKKYCHHLLRFRVKRARLLHLHCLVQSLQFLWMYFWDLWAIFDTFFYIKCKQASAEKFVKLFQFLR